MRKSAATSLPLPDARQCPIDGSEQHRAFVRVIHRVSLPFVAFPQIGKKPGGILVKMQEGPAFGVKDAYLFLDEIGARTKVLDQIADRLKGAHIGVFQDLLPDRPNR